MHGRILAMTLGALAAVMMVSVRAQERQIGGVGLTVFADPGFRGESATFRDDVSNLQSVGLNDRISSLRVGRGEVWEVCEHANCAGRCQVVSGSEADLRSVRWSDVISSARRIRGGGGGGGAWARPWPRSAEGEPGVVLRRQVLGRTPQLQRRNVKSAVRGFQR